MKIIFPHSLVKKEKLSNDDIKEVIKNTSKGIYTLIKGENLPRNSKLIKIYSTTIQRAKRIVMLMETVSGDSFFLFYRSKNDKIGKNISIQNQIFRKNLHKYLLILKEDIRSKNYSVFETV
ncbi:hypothetical protein COY05_05100 [Candidatus Peregrinibacteria bacterium CG_4_10_14_0_2_um_filter_38_24]|nr:MAG: hypothetical protein COY05_05100 [Candidatus Peregrinibacteria bacterium CG_4_10_14_0_2_um_filter_38_24]PJC39346.1 MAG: hypothetical protein CO044_00280 [Candidatus Peregrinibacteria bacterium CG_4_9_14_0_2_um_filter_38_9]